MADSGKFSREEVVEGKMYALLAYLSLLCIVPLIVKKNNPFVLAHGKQGLVLFVGEVGTLVLSILLPELFRPFLFVLWVFSFLGVIAVLRGQFIKLPIVAGIADKITL